MYADYDFYRGQYGGTMIKEEDFNKRAFEASIYIDEMTFNRLKDGWPIIKEVQFACCAIAEAIEENQIRISSLPPSLKAENTDGYSVTYAEQATIRQDTANAKMDALNLYIPSSDPLRYAGGNYAHECRYYDLL